jgi:hypothetical protein
MGCVAVSDVKVILHESAWTSGVELLYFENHVKLLREANKFREEFDVRLYFNCTVCMKTKISPVTS